MAYQVSLKKRAIKTLGKINEPYYSNIKKAIYNLAHNPRPAGYKKLKGRNGYRIRVTDYRIIYDIFDDILFLGMPVYNETAAQSPDIPYF
ncbi:type II toxin-antitoxin system RelE/ParE family toxin [Agriterribacter sp.]|uniref:type II toxin-antitoxin system RelE family toxin n=1 Tax=Agriterribacter sp. TaxID=2821509 RepID=UPI002B5B24E3|nr:type II toxin-antitoxin system RelE/ParE family toxin [Agriterribacter sp.]HRP57893.1 type II toxin-antitoxin system RelE/ParE family toxin [Agriterribacter sp.]